MSDLYILGDDGRTPVLCGDPCAWAFWHQDNKDACLVCLDNVGAAYVSTRFIGLAMGVRRLFHPDAPALLFETVAFDAAGDIVIQNGCATWAQAEQQHADALAWLRRMVNG